MGLPPPTGSPSEVPILTLALRWTLQLVVSPLSTVIQAEVSKGDLALYKHTAHILASSLSRESSLRECQGGTSGTRLVPRIQWEKPVPLLMFKNQSCCGCPGP